MTASIQTRQRLTDRGAERFAIVVTPSRDLYDRLCTSAPSVCGEWDPDVGRGEVEFPTLTLATRTLIELGEWSLKKKASAATAAPRPHWDGHYPCNNCGAQMAPGQEVPSAPGYCQRCLDEIAQQESGGLVR